MRKISELLSLGFMIVGLKRANYGPGAASHVTKFLLSLLFTPFFSQDSKEIVIISSYWAHVGCKAYHKKWRLLLVEYYEGPWILVAHSA